MNKSATKEDLALARDIAKSGIEMLRSLLRNLQDNGNDNEPSVGQLYLITMTIECFGQAISEDDGDRTLGTVMVMGHWMKSFSDIQTRQDALDVLGKYEDES